MWIILLGVIILGLFVGVPITEAINGLIFGIVIGACLLYLKKYQPEQYQKIFPPKK